MFLRFLGPSLGVSIKMRATAQLSPKAKPLKARQPLCGFPLLLLASFGHMPFNSLWPMIIYIKSNRTELHLPPNELPYPLDAAAIQHAPISGWVLTGSNTPLAGCGASGDRKRGSTSLTLPLGPTRQGWLAYDSKTRWANVLAGGLCKPAERGMSITSNGEAMPET